MAHRIYTSPLCNCSFWFHAPDGPRKVLCWVSRLCISLERSLMRWRPIYPARAAPFVSQNSQSSPTIRGVALAAHLWSLGFRFGEPPRKLRRPWRLTSPKFPQIPTEPGEFWYPNLGCAKFQHRPQDFSNSGPHSQRQFTIKYDQLTVSPGGHLHCPMQIRRPGKLGRQYSRRQGTTWQTLDSRMLPEGVLPEGMIWDLGLFTLIGFTNPAQCPLHQRRVCVLFRIGDLRETLMQRGCRW